MPCPLILEPLANTKRLTTLELNGCTLASFRGVNQIPSLEVLSVTHCRFLSDDIFDLIPNQLTYLKLLPISWRHAGKRWANFIKHLKTLNPWMDFIAS
jgi:hypothetical protein